MLKEFPLIFANVLLAAGSSSLNVETESPRSDVEEFLWMRTSPWTTQKTLNSVIVSRNLSKNNISDDKQSKLKSLLPNCDISFYWKTGFKGLENEPHIYTRNNIMIPFDKIKTLLQSDDIMNVNMGIELLDSLVTEPEQILQALGSEQKFRV